MQNGTQSFKLIRAGRLIDGKGGLPIESGAVLVQGSQIVSVGPANQVLPPEGAVVETFDYPGKTVMPGMIDCHTHHNGFGDGRPGEDVAALPDEVLTLQAARNAKDSLFSGVTSIRDNGAKNQTMFRLRDAAQMGIIQAPRMVLCGRPIAIVGGHMGYFGSEVTGSLEAAREVRQLVKEGATTSRFAPPAGPLVHPSPCAVFQRRRVEGHDHRGPQVRQADRHPLQFHPGYDQLPRRGCGYAHPLRVQKQQWNSELPRGRGGADWGPGRLRQSHGARGEARVWALQNKKEAQGLTPQERPSWTEPCGSWRCAGPT